MGKSYSYSIVVEQGGTLLINDQEIPLPAEAASTGDDPLGWALNQVRESYSSYYAKNQDSELNLSVRDRRPGGLVRRAKFTHPNSGIDLDTFLGNRRPGSEGESARTTPDEQVASGVGKSAATNSEEVRTLQEKPVEAAPEPSAPDAESEQQRSAEANGEGTGLGKAAEAQDAHMKTLFDEFRRERGEHHRMDPENPKYTSVGDGAGEVQEVQGERPSSALPTGRGAARATTADAPRREGTAAPSPAPVSAIAPGPTSYDERVRGERGWKKLPREKSTRPQVGSAENEGRSKKLGLLAEAQKQRTFRIVGIVVLIILVIVGFRLFNGGTEYEAVCVDQRTMTRTATGVACENAADTNHRWWFTTDAENLPSPGDTIDTQAGTFDEPGNDKDTINWHLENEEPTG